MLQWLCPVGRQKVDGDSWRGWGSSGDSVIGPRLAELPETRVALTRNQSINTAIICSVGRNSFSQRSQIYGQNVIPSWFGSNKPADMWPWDTIEYIQVPVLLGTQMIHHKCGWSFVSLTFTSTTHVFVLSIANNERLYKSKLVYMKFYQRVYRRTRYFLFFPSSPNKFKKKKITPKLPFIRINYSSNNGYAGLLGE